MSWKDRKAILPAINAIYRAENAEMALVIHWTVAMGQFAIQFGERFSGTARR